METKRKMAAINVSSRSINLTVKMSLNIIQMFLILVRSYWFDFLWVYVSFFRR